jgi:hypothetical protein
MMRIVSDQKRINGPANVSKEIEIIQFKADQQVSKDK